MRFSIWREYKRNLIQMLFASADGKLYLLDGGDLYGVSFDSGEIIGLVNGSKFILANPNHSVIKIVALAEDDFLVQASGEEGDTEIWRIHYDPEAEFDPERRLAVWSLYENRAVQSVVSDYLTEHPDCDITVENFLTFSKSRTAEERDDVLKEINTRILAGEAPDILLLDGLPAARYAHQGLLMNLEGKVDVSNLYAIIPEQLKREKGLFYLPAEFAFYGLQMENKPERLPRTLADWTALVAESPRFDQEEFESNGESYRVILPGGNEYYEYPADKKPLVQASRFQSIYDLFWSCNEPALLAGSKINEENLAEFLTAVKTMADKTDIFTAQEYGRAADYDPDQYIDFDLFGGMGYYDADLGSGSYRAGLSRAQVSLYSFPGSFSENSLAHVQRKNEPEIDRHPGEVLMALPALTGGTWVPGQLWSITAQSKQPDLAAELIQYVLSTGEQAKNQNTLPVDRSALARMVENEKAAHERAMEEYEGKEDGEITVSFSFDYDIEAITAQLHTPLLSDHVIHRQAWLPVLHYARGEIGQEEAIAQITEAARIYLAERAE